MSRPKEKRAMYFRALHAEAQKRGIDHDALHDICVKRYAVHTMGELTEHQLGELYAAWTGKGLRRRTAMPTKGDARPSLSEEMVSGDDLNSLALAFSQRGWGAETQRNFIRRQLHGREQIRTKRDFWKVFSGVRAMNRREEK